MSLNSFQKWKREAAFLPFEKETDKPDYTVVFRETEMLPAFSEKILHEDNCYRVHPDGKDGYVRSFFDAPRDYTPYAVAQKRPLTSWPT